MKRKWILCLVLGSIGLGTCCLGSFGFLVYGPATLTPPPNWPFTEDARKQYQPFNTHSKRVVKTFLEDAKEGRIKP